MKELSLINCRLDKRYDICEELGRGSYAEIYLARDILASPQSPHSRVVIKALNVFLQDDLDADLERTLVENFQNEAIALDRVRHPNIISRIGHGTARDLNGMVFHYIVLEYLPGGDMQSAVRKHQVSFNRAFAYVEQVCAGLGHAHSHGVIHRDIKPQNLLLTADHCTVKIADFGVARINYSDSPITRVGTNIYAPPEHSPIGVEDEDEYEKIHLSPAADIYSLAKTIYTLVTGEAPRAFANKPITQLPDSVKNEDWADDLLRVIRKATESDPNARQQNVAQFWDDLRPVRELLIREKVTARLPAQIDLDAEPQSRSSEGYTSAAPARPHFESVSDPAINLPQGEYGRNMGPVVTESSSRMENSVPVSGVTYDFSGTTPQNTSLTGAASPAVTSVTFQTPRRSNTLRRLLIFSIFLVIFAGILYGTASYMRGKSGVSGLRGSSKSQMAVANTDIFLRPSPNTDNDPIGLVTRNSKVKIVNSQNNWYQVDIIEQGRETGKSSASRGWLNGKYLDVNDN